MKCHYDSRHPESAHRIISSHAAATSKTMRAWLLLVGLVAAMPFTLASLESKIWELRIFHFTYLMQYRTMGVEGLTIARDMPVEMHPATLTEITNCTSNCHAKLCFPSNGWPRVRGSASSCTGWEPLLTPPRLDFSWADLLGQTSQQITSTCT